MNDRYTGEEIRRFIQAFLDARTRALPTPRRPALLPLQESQDEFGDLDDIDLDDPQVIAAVEGKELQLNPAQKMDKHAASVSLFSRLIKPKLNSARGFQIIQSTVSPAIYRLIDKHLRPEVDNNSNGSAPDTDPWIQCWAGCACILVQNGLRVRVLQARMIHALI